MSFSGREALLALALSLLSGTFSSFPLQAQSKPQRPDPAPEITVDASGSSTPEEIGGHVAPHGSPSCNGGYRWLDHPTTVAQFAGGTVKTIRVIHYAGRIAAKPPSLEELRDTVAKVWQGKFQSAFCSIPWAEANWWTSESTLEFTDGKRGTLITDGVHVFLLDYNGNPWFFRLYPAAQ
jgi:hypothetical protein